MKTMFSKRLQELREEAGLSQKKLSEKINVSAASIGYYENGTRDPGLDIAAEIAQFFGVSLDYMAGISAFRDPAALHISARTGLPEIALEILEARYKLRRGGAALFSDADILCHILQSSVPPLTFAQYLAEYGGGIATVYDDSGEPVGALNCARAGSGMIEFHPDTEGKNAQTVEIEVKDFDAAAALPPAFRQKMRENYERYSALSRRCKGGTDIMEILAKYYENADFSGAKLSYNRDIGMGVITGDVTEDFLGKRSEYVKSLYDLCDESLNGVTTLPIASLLDEVTLRELGDALRELRAKHMTKEPTNAKEN